MSNFTPDTLIRDVLVGHPYAAEVFARYGLGCASCLAAEMETLRAVADMHGVAVNELLDALDRASSEGEHAHD